MIYLLDVNVLLALGDSNHPHRNEALRFFEKTATVEGWATCPLTENAFLRILGGLAYPNGPGSTMSARPILTSILHAPGHQFWHDNLSLCDTKVFPKLPSSQNLTDLYLLALAVKNEGRLATFDSHIDSTLIPGGKSALMLLQKLFI